MMDETQVIPLRLSTRQCELMLRLLGQGPYELVAPLIGDIQHQCQMHEMRSRAAQQMPRLVPEGYAPLEQPGVAE